MNVASLPLCRELYELSGWGNGYKDLSELSAYWRAGKLVDNPTVHRYTPDVLLGEFYGRMLFTVPAYSLGYLLRKLPASIRVKDDGVYLLGVHPNYSGTSFTGLYRDMEDGELHTQVFGRTPEDAACKLLIELFKQGVLTKEEDNE